VLLKRVAAIGTGHTPSRQHPEYWEDCTIPWLTLADVWQLRDGVRTVVEDTSEKISELGLANSAAMLHRMGTVAMSRTASVGFSCILGRDMATSQDFVTWRCGPLIDARFLLYALRGLRAEILGLRMGSTHQTIYMPDIERISIPLPPLGVQLVTVDLLDAETERIAAVVEHRKRMLTLLEERNLALSHDMITGGMTTDERVKSRLPWLGDIPASWQVAPVGTQFHVQLGRMLNAERAANGDMRPYIKNINVRWDRCDIADLAEMDFPLAEREKYLLRPGDLLINEGGAGIGRSAVWDGQVGECYFQKSVLRLRPLKDANPLWMLECMRVATAQKVFLIEGNLATIPHVPAEALRAHRFPFPPRAAQDRLLERLTEQRSVLTALRTRLEQQVDRLREHRQALITAAVMGDLDRSRNAA
jgi:type I restriction enzyme S subunit